MDPSLRGVSNVKMDIISAKSVMEMDTAIVGGVVVGVRLDARIVMVMVV